MEIVYDLVEHIILIELRLPMDFMMENWLGFVFVFVFFYFSKKKGEGGALNFGDFQTCIGNLSSG